MTNHISAEPFPLYWPEDWHRTTEPKRFSPYKVTLHVARIDVLRQLKLMGASASVISCNLPVRRDGLPISGKGEPTDAGVAVYWLETHDDQQIERVIACDQWLDVKSNTRACGLALDALRLLKRSGASQVLDRVLATISTPLLAAANAQRTWREVFGWPADLHPTGSGFAIETVHARFRALVKLRHPDQGGSHEALLELNAAYKQALAELLNGATVSP